MTDDRFDRELAERLSAYEARLPDAVPPAAGTSPSGSLPRWPIIGVGALAAVAAVLLVAVLIRGDSDENVGTATPSPMPSASAAASEAGPSGSAEPDESLAATPTPQPNASGPEPTVELDWTEAASFGSPETPSRVNAVVRSDGGLVAVGVQYQVVLPNVGPTPPHEGRVWLSTDAVTWEDVTPGSVFGDAELRHLLVTSDRRIIAHGWVDLDELGSQRVAAWESIAGREWREIETGFPENVWPTEVAHGALGYLALAQEFATSGQAVWWSSDGRTWQHVQELDPDSVYRVGAGDEGFVVAGWRTSDQTPHATASGDGQDWFDATTPPGIVTALAPRGTDWMALSRDAEIPIGEPSTAGVWTSLNGLEWASAGFVPLETGDADCTEWPTSLYAAGPWLIAGTIMAYPCTEGGFVTHGAQRISLDGIEWAELPFGAASEVGNLGTRIGGALEIDGRLVLVGEKDRIATFWIGEQP